MKMKFYRLTIALFACLFFISAQTALASSVSQHREPALIINGVIQEIGATLDSTNTTMVPYREFFEALKMEATFDNKTKTVTAKNGDTTVTLTANSNTATVNGKDVQLYAGPFIDNGIMYVSLRFISEAFGGVVKFIKNGTDSEHLTVKVDFQKSDAAGSITVTDSTYSK
ncbi:copper amine oxidase N-terminal domain-containing protein [Paenibacillus humicola]|uniref:copper amine oxidase N-terminal domain-containing protein n=1 Tax=Paenibacillus humicola TaxID=3110540 RepID=UPI00237AFC9B|nr:copper amine oxidase N-terminal domain-containing protein [Paenibacillus humicola]